MDWPQQQEAISHACLEQDRLVTTNGTQLVLKDFLEPEDYIAATTPATAKTTTALHRKLKHFEELPITTKSLVLEL